MTLSTARDLMSAHLATLFVLDETGAMRAMNDLDRGPAPRVFWGRTVDGPVIATRFDVDPSLRAALREVILGSPARPSWDAAEDRLLALLEDSAPVEFVWRGPCFGFPERLQQASDSVVLTSEDADVLRTHLPDWAADVGSSDPVVAALADGAAVSVCTSVRISDGFHEAGVETHPDFRRAGYAATATLGWAAAVRELTATPLYSTAWENLASRALAARLGLIEYGHTFHAR